MVQWLDSQIERVKLYVKKYPDAFIFSFVTSGVLFFCWFIISGNGDIVSNIKGHYYSADTVFINKIKSSKRLDSINLCSNLKVISAYADNLKQSKFYLATQYQKYFILCYTIGVFFIAITAVVAFVMTKKGWDNSNRTRKGLLLTCAFYGVLLTTYPKLFDQEQNYKNNFLDFTDLSNYQIYIYKTLAPYLDKKDNSLTSRDSVILLQALDSGSLVLKRNSNIDFTMDVKQLDIKQIDYK